MKKLILTIFVFPLFSMGQSGCHVFRKIKFVDYGEDYKVRFDDYGEDLKIKYVSYGEKKVGKWKAVDYGEDFKVKIVKYGEDFKVKEVTYGEVVNKNNMKKLLLLLIIPFLSFGQQEIQLQDK